jgi:2-amino-4-hydroxy-6-hydroxymethyldihydropteridine diphosphokinase
MPQSGIDKGGIYIGLGANLPSPEYGTPRQTLEAAISALEAHGLAVVARSAFYESEPVPVSDQPWYLNAVVEVATDRDATATLALLHSVENAFGRVRGRFRPALFHRDGGEAPAQVGDGAGLEVVAVVFAVLGAFERREDGVRFHGVSFTWRGC